MTRYLLASASPRRRELLAQLGMTVEVRPTDLDESTRLGEAAADYVQRLALEKSGAAWAALDAAGVDTVPVLAADTAVVAPAAVSG